MARKNTNGRAAVAEQAELTEPALPPVLISPSQAKEHERDAYWIDLASNPDGFAEAIKTEDFWELLAILPEALWGESLRLYLYRKTAEDGVMIKNAPGEWNYLRIFYKPVDQQWISDNFGGGKYEFRLNWVKEKDNKTIRRFTFPIDGPPKVRAGQVVELDGKVVPLATAPAANLAADARTDVAKVIEASADANRQNMEILAKGSEAAIDLVKAQAQPQNNSLLEKILPAILERLMQPPPPPPPAPDPIDSFIKLQNLIAKQNPPEREEKETPIEETMGMIKTLTGADSLVELLKPAAKAAAADPTPTWVPIALNAIDRFFQAAPQLWHQSIQARDLEFRRAVWLRSAQPGQPPPRELLLGNPAPPPPATQAQPVTQTGTQTQPQPQPGAPGTVDPAQLATALVDFICHSFDKNPKLGYQAAAALHSLYGDHIEAFGIDRTLSNEEELNKYVTGIPQLAQRSQDARWAKFQSDFLDYTMELWGEDEPDDAEPDGKKPSGAIQLRAPVTGTA